GLGFGGIQHAIVRRQSHAIGKRDREHQLADLAAVGFRVVDAATIDLAFAPLAVHGEVEAAITIEDQVVRSVQQPAVAAVVHGLHTTCAQVHALDASALVVGARATGAQQAALARPLEAAVVADIDRTVRTDGGAIGAAAGVRDLFLRAIGMDARE